MVLKTERLTIRLPRIGEGRKMAAYFRDNREFLQPFYPRFAEDDFTDSAWEATMPYVRTEFEAQRAWRFALFMSDRVVGVINVTNIQRSARMAATIGYSLSERIQGRGLMKEALVAVIPRVFTDLELHRIEANYLPHNERSARVLASLGFEKEGLAKEYLQINGVFEDHVLTALRRSHWELRNNPKAK